MPALALFTLTRPFIYPGSLIFAPCAYNMLIKFGTLIGQAVGSAGGLTLQRSRYGFTARSKPLPSQPRTRLQSPTKIRVAQLPSLWRSLSDSTRSDWDIFAASVPWTNRLGDPVNASGWHAFLFCNVPTYSHPTNPHIWQVYTDPPFTTDAPFPQAPEVRYNQASHRLELHSSDPTIDPDCTLQVFASPVRSCALTASNVPMRFCAQYRPNSLFPLDLTPGFTSRWPLPNPFVPSMAIYWRMYVRNTSTGWRSAPTFFKSLGK